MANCMATCVGVDSNREKEDHRLGSRAARARAATWHTAAVAYVEKDGRGYVLVTRNGVEIHSYEFGPES